MLLSITFNFVVFVWREFLLVPGIRLHHDNTPVKFTPPHTPLLYSKTRVYRGIYILPYFCSKT